MAKKKQPTPQLANEPTIIPMKPTGMGIQSPNLEMLKTFSEVAKVCDPHLHNALEAIIEAIEKLKPKDKEALLDFLALVAPEDDEDYEEDDEDDNEDDEDYEEDDDDEDDEYADDAIYHYPHFLPRPEVKKFTLRVTLRGSDPNVYRKFVVPSNITLRHLSELLLELMGWENEHLNQFRSGDNYYAPAYQREGEMPDLFSRCRNYNQEDCVLADLLSVKGKTITWEYDFGDSWHHDIRLSSVGDYKDDEPRVSFVKGECACPPEDCGGIWGYEELLQLHAKRKAGGRLTREEKSHLDWYDIDRNYDPTDFDADYATAVCEDYCE